MVCLMIITGNVSGEGYVRSVTFGGSGGPQGFLTPRRTPIELSGRRYRVVLRHEDVSSVGEGVMSRRYKCVSVIDQTGKSTFGLYTGALVF